MHYCSHCKTEKEDSAFAPSCLTKRAPWCRACYRSWYLERNGGSVQRSCDWCGTAMSCTGRRAAERYVYCSRRCKDQGRKTKRLEALAVAPERSCPHCGEALAISKRADAVWCSERCEQAAHNATRKASGKTGARAERIDRAYIVERDGRRCHLCGGLVELGDIHLDHVVPLSRGGTHTAENLRVAHSSCNTSKGNRGANDQLLLVG